MTFWRFQSDFTSLGEPIHSHHDLGLTLLSVVVAIMAASTLFPVIERYRAAESRHRVWWLVAGALSMGCGVWAMHFTAMLAHSLPMDVSYSIAITLFSMVPVILGSAATIYTSRLARPRWQRLGLAATALALGIGAMHYIGMEAILAPVRLYYHPGLFMLSLVVAWVLAWLGLYAKMQLVRGARRSWFSLISGSVILGLAVTAMHYVAMAATRFYPDLAITAEARLVLDQQTLGLMLILAVSLMVSLLLVATVVDRRLSRITASLADSETRFRLLAEISENGIFTFNRSIIYANPAVGKITGYTLAELNALGVERVFQLEARQLEGDKLMGSVCREVEIVTKTGDQRWLYLTLSPVRGDGDSYLLATLFDITDRKNLEQELRKLAFYDAVTGLPNRSYFMEQLGRQYRQTESRGYAVLFVNVDRFKLVNNNFGLRTGDELLRQVTLRLQQRLRQHGTLARVGGDEFAILLDNIEDQAMALAIAQDLQNSFIKSFLTVHQELFVSVSMGVAIARASYRGPEDIYRDANISMNTAKRRGKGTICVFDTGMQHLAQERLQMETELRRALQRRELELFYQPIVSLSDGNRLEGFEALLRWRRADGSYVPPAQFIPLAEESGLIHSLGNWVMETACQQLEEWNREAPEFSQRGYISVNISSAQFFQTDLLTNVIFLIHQHQLKPGQLRLELTEGILMEDSPQLIGKLRELRSLGCPIMLDDFGTGYSSLSYLHRFPVSVIKVDQSFVRDLISSGTSLHLIQAIISMAHALGLKVVAEGIETEDIMYQLAQMGCESGQGYLFSRPLPAKAASDFMRERIALTG